LVSDLRELSAQELSALMDGNQPRGAAALHLGGKKPAVIVAAYKAVARLEVSTGQPVSPLLRLEMPLVGLSAEGEYAVSGRGRPSLNPHRFALWAPETGKVLWDKTPQGVAASVTTSGNSTSWFMPLPLLTPLTGKDVPDLVFPTQVIDGATGEARWKPPPFPRHTHTSAIGRTGERRHYWPDHPTYTSAIGPDLNGDGVRDLLTAYTFWSTTLGFETGSDVLRLEGRSGADGAVLAHSQMSLAGLLPQCARPEARSLHWLTAGTRAKPQAVVTCGCQADAPWLEHSLLVGLGGQVERTWPEVTSVRAGDLDGDGLADFVGLLRNREGIKLTSARGRPPEVWRRPGIWRPMIEPENHIPTGSGTNPAITPPLSSGDLDGDGVSDVLLFRPVAGAEPALEAYSGKHGRLLWQVHSEALRRTRDEFVSYCYWLECRDLERDGEPEVLFAYLAQNKEGGSEGFRIAVLAGRTGRIRWQTPVACATLRLPAVVDVSGDGVLDLVVPVAVSGPPAPRTGDELWAFDGSSGELLWRRSQGPASLTDLPLGPAERARLTHDPYNRSTWQFDLTGDGREARISLQDDTLEVRVAKAGQRLWSWPIPGGRQVLAGNNNGIRAILPATPENPAVIVLAVNDGRTVYGVDGKAGQAVWRCDGPGAFLAVTPGGPGRLPAVWFRHSGPDITACVEAMPAEPNGHYRPWNGTSTDYRPLADDAYWSVPLPWEYAARQRLGQALWPGLACAVLLVSFVAGRRWWTAAVLLACLLLLPLLVGSAETSAGQLLADERYGPGWYWLWPLTLTSWKGWTLLTNPLFWMTAWTVCLLSRWLIQKKRL
jgi:hypothetical protein